MQKEAVTLLDSWVPNARSFLRLVGQVVSAGFLMVLGRGFREVANWAMPDMVGREHLELLVNGVSGVTIAIVSVAIIVAEAVILVDETLSGVVAARRRNRRPNGEEVDDGT